MKLRLAIILVLMSFLIIMAKKSYKISNASNAENGVTSNDWEKISPGGGGWFRSIRFNPKDNNKIYLVSDLGGFYKSTDGGNTWSSSNTGMDNLDCSSIAVHPDGKTIFIGTGGGIYKSIDEGNTWSRKGEEQIYPAFMYKGDLVNDDIASSISAIFIHPADSDLIFAGTGYTHPTKWSGPDPAKIYRSTDGGETWSNASEGLIQTKNSFGSFAGSSNNSEIIYAGTYQGLYRSINKGLSWSKLQSERVRWVETHPTNPNEIYWSIIYSGGGLYRSTNGGTSKVKVGNNMPILGWNVKTVPQIEEIHFSDDGNRVYAGITNSPDMLYYSDDNGANWSTYPRIKNRGWWKKSGGSITSFDIVKNGQKIYFCNDIGIFGSDDNGTTFPYKYTKEVSNGKWRSTGADVNTVTQILLDPNDVNRIIRLTKDTGVQISEDLGYSWRIIDGVNDFGRSSVSAVRDATNSNIIYMIQGESKHGVTDRASKLIKSTDNGLTWADVGATWGDGTYYKLARNGKGDLFATSIGEANNSGWESGIYKSTDYGISWVKKKNGIVPRVITIDPLDESIMYCGDNRINSNWYGLYKSTDYGETWSAIATNNIRQAISITIDPTNSDIVYVGQRGYSNVGFGGLWKSVNGGTSFVKIHNPSNPKDPGYYNNVVFDPTNSNRIFTTNKGQNPKTDWSSGEGILMSEDGGKTWISLNKNLPYKNITTLEISPLNGNIYVGTNGGGSYKLAGLESVSYETPIITQQPISQDKTSGSSASFFVSATCDDEIGYRWWKSPFVSVSESKISNTSKYSGVTTNTLTIINVDTSDNNTKYVCEIYNIKDSSNRWINSSITTLTITSNSLGTNFETPIITSQPKSIIVNENEDVSFIVKATCDDDIGYQWWKSPFVNEIESKIVNNSKYLGTTTNQLIIKEAQTTDADVSYVCEVYNKLDQTNLKTNSKIVGLTVIKPNIISNTFSEIMVILEGPFQKNGMVVFLQENRYLPKAQPYNFSPFNYLGTQNVETFSNNIVDWVLIELRSDEQTRVNQFAALLRNDGMLLNSLESQDFTNLGIEDGDYYLVIHHRNHLSIMSKNKISIINSIINYNFTTNIEKAYGTNSMVKLENGYFALYSGNGDANSTINKLDFRAVANNIFSIGYKLGDIDMNGKINVLDYSKINKNISQKSNVP